MPKDKRTAKVEGFKITAEMKEWQRRGKELAAVKQILEAKGFEEMGRIRNLRELWTQASEEYDQHLRKAPVEPVRELSGMDFVQKDEERRMRL